MARKLDDLIIGLQLRTKALEDGLKTAQKELKKFASESESSSLASENRKNRAIERAQKESLNRQKQQLKESERAYEALAIAAAAAFYKVVQAVNSGLNAYNQNIAALTGLKSIADGVGVSYKNLQREIDNYTNDGLIPATQAATALKNLLSRGYTDTQAVEVLERLKDAAAFGRQASLGLGEAVASATEGLKNENSILVDNAGVTKNVSVMWKEYAETIGKSVNDLTKAEKIQAEYNGIMQETKNQVGDAAKLSAELAGAQAKNAAATLKLQQAFGEGLAPAMAVVLNLVTPIIQGLAEFAKANPALVAGITTAATVLLGLVTAMTAVGAAIKVITPALAALNIGLGSLMLNPVVLGLAAVAAGVAIVATQVNKAKKQQELYNSELDKYNKIRQEGITKTQVPALQEELNQIKKLSDEYDKLTTAMRKFNEEQELINNGQLSWTESMGNRSKMFYNLEQGINNVNKQFAAMGLNANEAKSRIDTYTNAIKEAEKATLQELNTMAKETATKKVAQTELENLIKKYKSAEQGSKDWQEAQKQLAEQFPQFSTAAGIQIEAIEAVVKAQNDGITKEWEAVQEKIKVRKTDLETTIQTESAKQEAIWATIELQNALNDGVSNTVIMNQIRKYNEAGDKIKALKEQLTALDALANTPIDQITGVKPINYNDDLESAKNYQNEALDNHMKYLNHKKALDELSLEQELNEYEWALKAFAVTEDEKNDLIEKAYATRKAIRDRDQKAQEESNQALLKTLQEQEQDMVDRTANSTAWIERKKTIGELSTSEEIAAYNRVIAYHKDYLNRIISDENIAASDKERIQNQELKTIQEYQDRIIGISKAATEKAVNNYIDAKKKQYDWEESEEEKRLNKKLSDLEKEYDDKEKALRAADRNNELQSLYAEEAKYRNAATKAGQDRLKEIRENINNLNKEAAKENIEAEKEARKTAIEQEITDNKEKYTRLRNELETEQKSMLLAATAFANDSVSVLNDSTVTLAGSIKNIISTFSSESENLLKQGLNNLQKYIPQYQKLMDSLTYSPVAGEIAAVGGGGTVVNVIDNGDKIINSKDEAIDYTKELFNTAHNAVRSMGG